MSDQSPLRILKRGRTLRWSGVVKDDLGVPLDLTPLDVQSQVRGKTGSFVASATFTKADQTAYPGRYAAVFPPTHTWPLVQMIWDVAVLTGTDILISETLRFEVERSATEVIVP
ncbi:MAG: hypothetical protein ACT4QA_18325 [Panacagrimonas sp.]